MGIFSSSPEKKAKKQEDKDFRKALEAVGRTNYVMVHHIGGFPGIDANSILGVSQGVEKNTLRLNGIPVTVTGLQWGESGERSLGKAAVGAIGLGLLTGGIGAIAGAAIGGKKQDNSTVTMTCTDSEGIMEYTVYIRADAEKYQKLASLL
ncbi:hypothetical protein H1230_13220 [Paenibacillus sp. 19GGS1-52]|uniref:hypothetical protein n=1 Tax=Paenibacillus sp. 19GGS1-52 TaxID=2758563 RepID=UPI001EFAB95F|nr:hypothetical protein [Paenibacillus sp. 19GGS1-52]ULO09641.1 hypothetical protein H1230_13220 [Paenibacillus sp. 19GGS1-52]